MEKQTVYLPVGEFNNSERCICTIGIPDLYGDKVVEQEGYFFTPEQLNEYTQNVIKQSLETAAEKAEIKEDTLDTESYKKADEFAEGKSYSYVTDTDGCLVGVDTFEVNKQSITNTFEETYKKFEV